MTINYTDFEKVDIRVGTIVEITAYPKGKYSTHVLMIDFGDELGVKKSLARIAPNYGDDIAALIGKQIVAVTNFEPKQIGEHMSEVLTLGVPDENDEVVLLHPGRPVPNGGKLY